MSCMCFQADFTATAVRVFCYLMAYSALGQGRRGVEVCRTGVDPGFSA